jgi:hemin uptake protein HemP
MRIVIVLAMQQRPDGTDRSPPRIQPGASAPGTTPRIRSDVLLGGRTELVIEHQGREYRLRITQNGKLILTA